jgi:hypothetical protein
VVQLGDSEHSTDILEILGASGEDLQRDEVLRRNHRDVMPADCDDVNLIEKTLFQSWPCKYEVEVPARWLVGDGVDPGLDGKGFVRDPWYEPCASKRCDEKA